MKTSRMSSSCETCLKKRLAENLFYKDVLNVIDPNIYLTGATENLKVPNEKKLHLFLYSFC